MARISKIDNSEEEIDLKKIFGILSKGKKIIASITASTLLFGSLYLIIKKPVYEGQFQIVLKSNESSSNPLARLSQLGINTASIPSGILGNSGLDTDLFTEIGILKSPLVLMSIFNEAKQNKIINGEKVEELTFTSWLEDYLTIELERGTSILNLSYRDKNKNEIIPTLKKISEKYQIYSSRDRKRSINQGIDYLNSEIEKYAVISKKSAKELQVFALEQDLPAQSVNSGGVGGVGGVSGSEMISNSTDIDTIRMKAINSIRITNQKLKLLNDNYEQENTFNIGSSIEEIRLTGLPKSLELLERELAVKRSMYTQNDPILKNLEKERISLMKLLNQTTKEYLRIKKQNALAKLKSAEREEDILFKYGELQKQAARDDQTLLNLKNQLRVLNLEKTRYLNPWELITQPTLNDEPVSPNKKRVVGLSIILGLAFGSSYVLYKNKNDKA